MAGKDSKVCFNYYNQLFMHINALNALKTFYDEGDVLLYDIFPSNSVQVTQWTFQQTPNDSLHIMVGGTYTFSGKAQVGTVVKLEHSKKSRAYVNSQHTQ